MKRILRLGLLSVFSFGAMPLLAAPSASAPEDAAHRPARVPVGNAPYTRTLRSNTPADLERLGLVTGIYQGSPQVQEKQKWYEQHFYDTLASRKVWKDGTSPYTHEARGPITWDIVPIPQYVPPPCDRPQPTGYDAEGCRMANAMFKDVERTDPRLARELREKIRRGRDVWHKGTFGNQDEEYLHTSRTVGKEFITYPWLDTRTRPHRYTRWGMINDPDCVQGNAASNWYDICQDPHSSGVLGYRRYHADPLRDASGKVIFDPKTSPYREDEISKNLRYVVGGACTQCHVAFDPTNPPKDPNNPKWENLHELIGNQFTNQPLGYIQDLPKEHPAFQVLNSARIGTVDTSLQASDFQHNPGTQNNITDFVNRRVFVHRMQDPITGRIAEGRTQHVLKGGEDSVGDRLALIRVYVNIGMCTEECWVPKFPVPGSFFGASSRQQPFRIKECAASCEAWNHADAKMGDLAFFLLSGGPTDLMKARDVDGTPGSKLIDLAQVPRGRDVFARNCAGCHSSFVPPANIREDKEALAAFFEGHAFGSPDTWQLEFDAARRNAPAFQKKFLARDPKSGRLLPKQFVERGIQYGQDWLGNDEPTPFGVIGTNMCRAMHDNHNQGHIWEEFSSITYKERQSPGSVPNVLSRMVPVLGGMTAGRKTIEGGPGYLRNISLLSLWSIAPFLHNNAIGEMTYLKDGGPDYTVRGRVQQFELAMAELLTSDNPQVTPHRKPKTAVTDRDIKVAPREDMQGPLKLPVKQGTPVAYFASSNPHRPVFQKCDDLVENKGHQFGVDLSPADKKALTEFLKLM